MRSLIAVQAARLMAAGGTEDFALAKRKAARQLGAPATQAMPDNEEIEAELRTYRELFQGDDYPGLILELRHKALSAMRFFQKFDPYLTGSVLKGTAGLHSAINVQLFAANEKDIALFLLNHAISFKSIDQTNSHQTKEREISVIELEWDGAPLRLTIHDPLGLRVAQKAYPGRPASERAGIAALERLLEAATMPGCER